MNNRFKFRIFINNEIQEVFYFYKSENGVIFACTDLEDDTGFNIDGSTLMQSTGLKDKNGKLIYENDIVKFKTELFGKPKQIIWDECHYILKDTFIILCDMEIKQFGLEVIGNIYQDSHLLENAELL